MLVKKLVVHFLQKEEGGTGAQVIPSLALLPIDEQASELVERLDANYNRYTRSSIIYAELDIKKQCVFPSEFQKYTKTKTDDGFLDFSTKAMNDLRTRVENTAAAKGGFLVFAEYENNDRNFISVYLIRDTKGMLFQRQQKSSSYAITTVTHLDLSNLAMACRINIEAYSHQEESYLEFIKRKMERISNYFIQWVTAENRESNKIFTEKLYDLISQVKLPRTEDGEEMSRDEFRGEVYDYIKTSSGGIVDLYALSAHFYRDKNGEPDESYLITISRELGLPINTMFQADASEMKKFVRVDLSADNIHLRFSRTHIDEGIVRLDDNNEDLVIIQSQELADSLRREMNSSEQIE
jgi:nucleoid-associated protein